MSNTSPSHRPPRTSLLSCALLIIILLRIGTPVAYPWITIRGEIHDRRLGRGKTELLDIRRAQETQILFRVCFDLPDGTLDDRTIPISLCCLRTWDTYLQVQVQGLGGVCQELRILAHSSCFSSKRAESPLSLGVEEDVVLSTDIRICDM
eukprot:1380722-Amorphochlora_amoeboformis.AAC.1